ncbi:MAG: DUF4974 domain-containing protein [Odoribacter sp.]
MDNKDKIFHISLLITKYLSDEMTTEEERDLEIWKNESSHHQQLFQDLCSDEMKRCKAKLYADNETEEVFKFFIQGKREWKRRRNRRYIYRGTAYAALFLLPLCFAFLFLFNKSTDFSVFERIGEDLVVKNKPTLVLSDGNTLALGDAGFHLCERNGVSIEMEQGNIVYNDEEISSDSLLYNTLEVPLYADFKITLSDGTKVYMNAGSSLKFPVAFGKENRTVYGSGEIYLEVAKDCHRPFFVVLNDLKVEVLGTRFNINSYRDEGFVEVTLAEGHIAAYVDECRYDLKPCQQLYFDKNIKQAQVREVKPSDYISWISGEYVFKGKTFKEVARVLERWYDVKINFTNARCGSMIYTGVIQKDQSISELVSLFEKSSDIKCSINGKDIFIK